jgi:hypothetical protein
MAVSFGSSSSTTKTQQQSQSEPWAPAIPYLTRYMQDTDMLRSLAGPSGDQLDAFTRLKELAAGGNPFAGDIKSLTSDALGYKSRSGIADQAYSTLQSQLGDYASGKYLDFESNPYIQKMLSTVGNDVQNRINQMFAGAGRDVTGNAAGQQAIARGVTQAQLPILQQLYGREQENQMNAANMLYGAGRDTAMGGQNMDMAALDARAKGIGYGNEFINSQSFGANQILNLDEQLKRMPFDDMAMYGNLLLPAAGLGGQQAGSGVSKTSGSGFGISLSDARTKDDGGVIGELADGTPLHIYTYKGDDTPRVGVMAQEVEKTNPGAVVRTGIGDLKAVDYDAVLDKARRVMARKRAN